MYYQFDYHDVVVNACLPWSIMFSYATISFISWAEVLPSSIVFFLQSLVKYYITQNLVESGFLRCFAIPSPIIPYSALDITAIGMLLYQDCFYFYDQHNFLQSRLKNTCFSWGENPSFEYFVAAYPFCSLILALLYFYNAIYLNFEVEVFLTDQNELFLPSILLS